LQLGDNHIANAGATALANALPYNLALRHLDLSSNQLDDSAAEAFADVLVGANRVFESLNLDGNLDITNTGEYRLKHAFRYRVSFRKWFGRVLQDNLSTLDLFSRTVGDEELIALSKRPNSPLKALYIGGELITDRGASVFAKNSLANEECNLTRLYIQHSHIGDEGVAAIAEALKSNRSLRVLSLTYSDITARGANALRSMIQENDTLQRLNLSGNNIGDEGLVALLNGLQHSTTLTALNLVGTSITDAEVDGIGDTCLKELNLSGNDLTDQGALKLASSLLEDCSLERLCLAGNKLTAKGGKALAAVLPSSTRFTY
jgi:Leucine-rich repeat (LRR) protein